MTRPALSQKGVGECIHFLPEKFLMHGADVYPLLSSLSLLMSQAIYRGLGRSGVYTSKMYSLSTVCSEPMLNRQTTFRDGV